MIRRLAPVLVAGAALLSGCAQPIHMSRDFGRSYTEAFTAQTDLTRASVNQAQHPLEGNVAIRIRLQEEEAASDKASPEITLGGN
jgi:hypothetical protein